MSWVVTAGDSTSQNECTEHCTEDSHCWQGSWCPNYQEVVSIPFILVVNHKDSFNSEKSKRRNGECELNFKKLRLHAAY